MSSIRVRFAPSPTGNVHIGNIRAAIFNWLFARHEGGSFLLRIEDTDRERSTPEAVKAVLDAMEWLGLNWDEDPLYQSARQAAHTAAAEVLVKKGAAYREDKGGTGQGECIIFRMPPKSVSFRDLIKGDIEKKAEDLKDFVIVRSDGSPVFHLANVVDDIHMGITHVIRGDDHVENTFKHLALFEALGSPAPSYAHLPMIVNNQGKPYSKRDGAAFVGEFREKGYLPEALLNSLVLLGWSPGGDKEIMSRDEMVSLFGLDRVKSSAAQMDMKKFEWMNAEYMRMLPKPVFKEGCKKAMDAAGIPYASFPDEYLDRVLALMQDRTRVYTAVSGWRYFFGEDYPREEDAVRKNLKKEGIRPVLESLRRKLEIGPFTAKAIEEAIRSTEKEAGISEGKLNQPARVAVTGSAIGAGIYETMEVLGKERTLARMAHAIEIQQF